MYAENAGMDGSSACSRWSSVYGSAATSRKAGSAGLMYQPSSFAPMKYGPCNAYFTMVEWADRFDIPICLHEADRQCAMRPSERIHFWSGDTYTLPNGMILIRLGGHFAGGTVLYWQAGAGGRGALLSGDIIQVVSDRRWVSFMYSYPNLIPLPAAEVQRIRDMIEPYQFERLYGAWFERVVMQDAHNAVMRSAKRYIRALERIPQS